MTGANNQKPVIMYCDMERLCCSNGARGWMKVADVDMTDSNQQCPNGFKLNSRTTAPLRTCGRPDRLLQGCVSTTYPVNGVQYSRVCVGELLHINLAHLAHLILLRLIIPSMALFSPTGSLVDSIFGLFRADLAKPMMIYQRDVPVMVALWLYLHSLGRTTFVTQLLEVTELLKVCGMLTIHSGTVKDVGVPVLAVTSTTHRSSASNYLSRQQMTLSLGFVKTVNQYMR